MLEPGAGTLRYSVVVPVFGNQETLGEVVERLRSLSASRPGGLEAVFVIDGSPDDSAVVLRRALAPGSLPAQVVVLSRNFGSFSAIRTGLAVARGEYIAVMAADLQEPPSVVEAFFDALESGRCDIAIGARVGRADPAGSALSSGLYWRLYRRLINRDVPEGGVDVFGVTRQVARDISSLGEVRTSLIGLLYWVGFRRLHIPYERAPRAAGRSHWTTSAKLSYLLDSIYAFTDVPILALQAIGVFGVIGSVVLAVLVFIAWLLGAIQQPGYTPLMIAILGSTSAVLLALGIVGSYVWRTYENGKGRPVTLIARHEIIDGQGADRQLPSGGHRE